jgi:hypothetical protein
MDSVELIREISDTNLDVEKFAQMAVRDEGLRDEIMRQMITHPHIMVYYHCYYVTSKASEERPDLFLKYWDEIVPLLRHKNSYHRDIGLTLLANLSRVDQTNRFAAIFDEYFEHLNDPKFMTGHCCLQNGIRILKSKPEFKPVILNMLIDLDNRCGYTIKQKALLKSDVLEAVDEMYAEADNQGELDVFIRSCVDCPSPKTRARARELVKKYGLYSPV